MKIHEEKIRHVDLFSGIGGFSLALDKIFHDKEIEHTFVEWDPFCQVVLRKHWPGAEIHGDIDRFVADAKGRGRNHGPSEDERPTPPQINPSGNEACIRELNSTFILTGGFPCQPFSQAGRRKGTGDDRYKWPAMLAAISILRPEWVVAENVRGLATWNDGLVLETVCSDLEKEGYEVQPLVIPAVAVDAPHRRDRVWFVAHARHRDGQGEPVAGECRQEVEGGDHRESEQPASHVRSRNAPDPDDRGLQGRPGEGIDRREQEKQIRDTVGYENRGTGWDEDWPAVAARLCRMDDGLPAGVDGLRLTRAGHRVQRLKALGNAIVPQVAMEIMKAIRFSEKPR